MISIEREVVRLRNFRRLAFQGTLYDGVEIFDPVPKLKVDILKSFHVVVDEPLSWVFRLIFMNRLLVIDANRVIVVSSRCPVDRTTAYRLLHVIASFRLQNRVTTLTIWRPWEEPRPS